MARSTYIMNSFVLRFRRAVRRHGIIGMVVLATEYIETLASRLRPSVRAEIREREQRALDYDERFGVDTSGTIHQTKLNINNPNQLHAVSYGASDPKYFRDAIGSLSIDYRRFIFIDFGSGKGRAILLAMEFPFKRIIGVEFSEELHCIAQENIRRYHIHKPKCKDVESLCMDVVDYHLPDDCLACYFCNPFDSIVMVRVLSNIRKSLLQKPREIFIVYYNPKEGYLLDHAHADCFKRIGTVGPIRIWKTFY